MAQQRAAGDVRRRTRLSADVGHQIMDNRDRAPNEARPAVRILAAVLAVCCWGVAMRLGYALAFGGEDSRDSIKLVVGVALFGSVSSVVAVKGFVPPWVFRLIPHARSATHGKELRNK